MRYLLICSLILLGCEQNSLDNVNAEETSEDTLGSTEVTDTLPAKIEVPISTERSDLEAYLFLELDDMYSEQDDTSEVYPWIRKKTQTILDRTYTDELFSNGLGTSGGGPNGAYSTASTNLYVAIEFKTSTPASRVHVYLNGKEIVSRLYIETDLLWIKLPMKAWQNALRDIKPSDTLNMFEPGFMGVAGLTTGQVFKLEIQTDEKRIIKYYHCWFPTC